MDRQYISTPSKTTASSMVGFSKNCVCQCLLFCILSSNSWNTSSAFQEKHFLFHFLLSFIPRICVYTYTTKNIYTYLHPHLPIHGTQPPYIKRTAFPLHLLLAPQPKSAYSVLLCALLLNTRFLIFLEYIQGRRVENAGLGIYCTIPTVRRHDSSVSSLHVFAMVRHGFRQWPGVPVTGKAQPWGGPFRLWSWKASESHR